MRQEALKGPEWQPKGPRRLTWRERSGPAAGRLIKINVDPRERLNRGRGGDRNVVKSEWKLFYSVLDPIDRISEVLFGLIMVVKVTVRRLASRWHCS